MFWSVLADVGLTAVLADVAELVGGIGDMRILL
jgi:hypothetical protein